MLQAAVLCVPLKLSKQKIEKWFFFPNIKTIRQFRWLSLVWNTSLVEHLKISSNCNTNYSRIKYSIYDGFSKTWVFDSVTRFFTAYRWKFWHFPSYGANLCEVISNQRLIGGWNFLCEKYSKLSNLFAIFSGFVCDNLQWYLLINLCHM